MYRKMNSAPCSSVASPSQISPDNEHVVEDASHFSAISKNTSSSSIRSSAIRSYSKKLTSDRLKEQEEAQSRKQQISRKTSYEASLPPPCDSDSSHKKVEVDRKKAIRRARTEAKLLPSFVPVARCYSVHCVD
jgi:hypothetical protein